MVNSSRYTQEKDVAHTYIFLKNLMAPLQIFMSSIVALFLCYNITHSTSYSRQFATSNNAILNLTRDVDITEM